MSEWGQGSLDFLSPRQHLGLFLFYSDLLICTVEMISEVGPIPAS